jgi:hypothetical protein
MMLEVASPGQPQFAAEGSDDGSTGRGRERRLSSLHAGSLRGSVTVTAAERNCPGVSTIR